MNTETIGDRLACRSTAIDAVGQPAEQFRPSPANLVAGVILGLLLSGAGLALLAFGTREVIKVGGRMPMSADGQISWLSVGIMALTSIGLTVGGILLLRWVYSTSSLRVSLCPGGFFYESAAKTVAFPWDQIASVTETILHERVPLARGAAKYAMPEATSRSFLVYRGDGEKFAFNRNTLGRSDKLGETLREQAWQRNIPWYVVERYA
ncbi:hypothetical protein P12x_005659 [Tundrisphaera lichenicola]|uniref:hypothetical protein n=1 Tax=Tundrisphaera lichenicola TaxID=2029860 RepID=UPI003EB8DE20